CPVLAPSLDGAVAAAWAVSEVLKPERKPLDIQVTATEAGIDMDVRGSGVLNAARMTALAQLADKHRLARLTRDGELIAELPAPAGRPRAQAVRRRGVRPAAPGRRSAGPRACQKHGAHRRGGVLQPGNLRARCAHSHRWRLSPQRGDAGRPVPAFGPCRDRG